MEQKRYRGQHGLVKYFTEEERKRAYTKIKTKYMVNKEWRCNICNNHNYTLTGKYNHLNTKKHQTNIAEMTNTNSND